MGKCLHPRSPLKNIGFAVLLAIWCTNLSSAQNTQVENKPDSIRGTVVNSVTREPIGRALVYSPDNRFGTMTDSEGRFEFNFAQAETNNNQQGESEPAEISGTRTSVNCVDSSCTSVRSSSSSFSYQRTNGPEQLMARKPGFLIDQKGIQTAQSETAGREVTIPLTPESLVVGRVVLPTSEASDTIQLELYRRQVVEGRGHWFPAGSVSSKSNGEFRFAELSAGTYKLLTREELDHDPLIFDPHGQLYGYPPVYFPNASDFAAGQTIQLATGQIFQAHMTLVRHPYYPVKIAVANAPSGGINIIVSAQGHKGPGFSLGYNDRSQMIEGTLPNGNYTVEASNFGPDAGSGLLNISVKGAAVEGLQMTMVPSGSIPVNVKEEFTANEDTNSGRGFVINGRGRSLNVRLEPADDFGQERGGWLRPPSGAEDDSLVIEGVQTGRYWVKVDASRGFVASASSGNTDLQHQPLVVGLGGSGSPIEITLRDAAAEIDGTVQNTTAPFSGNSGTAGSASGVPVSADASTHVYFVPLPDSSGEFKDVWVGPDGKFGPQPLPPGTYRVFAFDRPQEALEYRNAEAMRAYDAKGLLVRLVAGQKEHLQLQLISSSE